MNARQQRLILEDAFQQHVVNAIINHTNYRHQLVTVVLMVHNGVNFRPYLTNSVEGADWWVDVVEHHLKKIEG